MEARELIDKIWGTKDMDLSEFNVSLQSTLSLMEKYIEEKLKKPNFKISVQRDDTIEAFGAYYESSIKDKEGGLVLLNVEACLAAGKVEEDLSVKEMILETLMHEVGHALEEWYDLNFDEDRIEKIIDSYRIKAIHQLKG
jgi:hypothetical protein